MAACSPGRAPSGRGSDADKTKAGGRGLVLTFADSNPKEASERKPAFVLAVPARRYVELGDVWRIPRHEEHRKAVGEGR